MPGNKDYVCFVDNKIHVVLIDTHLEKALDRCSGTLVVVAVNIEKRLRRELLTRIVMPILRKLPQAQQSDFSAAQYKHLDGFLDTSWIDRSFANDKEETDCEASSRYRDLPTELLRRL